MHITHINLARGFGGGERQTALLIDYLSGQGLGQSLVCRKDSPLRDHLRSVKNLEFRSANTMFHGHCFGCMKTHLFHAHDAKAAHWAFIESRFRKNGYIVTRRVLNPLKKYGITPLVYKRAAALVAISSKIRDNLNSYAPEQTVHVIPSATGSLPYRPEHVRSLKDRYKGLFVIGHIGSLKSEVKGQAHIIEAARFLGEKHKDLYFVFLGKGEDEGALKSGAEGMDNIEFAGYTDYPGDYLSVMNLFVFPSSREGFGSSILDAMSYGVPVIASNVGGIPDIVKHEKNGLLVPPRNSRALAGAIAMLYENTGMRGKFSREGRATASAFSPRIMGDRYLSLYRSILAQNSCLDIETTENAEI